MAVLNQDQRFVFLLIISLIGSSCICDVSEAQTFTAEDRTAIQKFMDSLLNFLEVEISNGTTTLAPTSNGTSLETTTSNGTSLETTTLASGNSTESSTELTTVASNSTSSVLDSSTSSLSSTSTTIGNASSTSTTETIPSTTRRTRICFKRFCYKFSNDKGYIV
ncbi:bypass of stop codon protein 1 [Drosophila eugracilis]|uniref:bypass of stop codon protein 1 n=1 Tax=Drosophila eugracilis TaxID=29029 RepID=UPI0007E626C5|nr:bypass of stop codon protein 1 [Drosophila eugracilis]